MSIEKRSSPFFKVREDLNVYRLKQDGQDVQDGQDEGGLGRGAAALAAKASSL